MLKPAWETVVVPGDGGQVALRVRNRVGRWIVHLPVGEEKVKRGTWRVSFDTGGLAAWGLPLAGALWFAKWCANRWGDKSPEITREEYEALVIARSAALETKHEEACK